MKREFGSDLLGGISIITSVLLGEYLAGAIIVLMLSGGEALKTYALRRGQRGSNRLCVFEMEDWESTKTVNPPAGRPGDNRSVPHHRDPGAAPTAERATIPNSLVGRTPSASNHPQQGPRPSPKRRPRTRPTQRHFKPEYCLQGVGVCCPFRGLNAVVQPQIPRDRKE